MATILQTDRLVLRELRDSDAPAVHRLASCREIALNTLSIPHPYPPELAQQFIERTRVQADKGEASIFAILLQETGEFLGTIGLVVQQAQNRAELGYWIGVEYWGNGYATEAAQAMLNYGFDELSLDRIHACYFPRNPSSGRVLEKIGMVKEGVMRQHVLKWDKRLDCVGMAILRTEWELRKGKP